MDYFEKMIHDMAIATLQANVDQVSRDLEKRVADDGIELEITIKVKGVNFDLYMDTLARQNEPATSDTLADILNRISGKED